MSEIQVVQNFPARSPSKRPNGPTEIEIAPGLTGRIIHPNWPGDRVYKQVGVEIGSEKQPVSAEQVESMLVGELAEKIAQLVHDCLYISISVDPTYSPHVGKKGDLWRPTQVSNGFTDAVFHTDYEGDLRFYNPGAAEYSYLALYNGTQTRECETVVTSRTCGVREMITHMGILHKAQIPSSVREKLRKIEQDLNNLLRCGMEYGDPLAIGSTYRTSYMLSKTITQEQNLRNDPFFEYQEAVKKGLEEKGQIGITKWNTLHRLLIIAAKGLHARFAPQKSLLHKGGGLLTADL